MHKTQLSLVLLLCLPIRNTFCSFGAIFAPLASKTALALSSIGIGVSVMVWKSAQQDIEEYALDAQAVCALSYATQDTEEQWHCSNALIVMNANENLRKLTKKRERKLRKVWESWQVEPFSTGLKSYTEELKMQAEKSPMVPLNVDQLMFLLESGINEYNNKSRFRVINAIGHHAFPDQDFTCYYQQKREPWLNRIARFSGLCPCCATGENINIGDNIYKQLKYINTVTLPRVKEEINDNQSYSLSQRNKAIKLGLISACCLGVGAYYRWIK